MTWLEIETAPFERDLEVAVIASDGIHSVAFPCRRLDSGWINAATRASIKVIPTHWRNWELLDSRD